MDKEQKQPNDAKPADSAANPIADDAKPAESVANPIADDAKPAESVANPAAKGESVGDVSDKGERKSGAEAPSILPGAGGKGEAPSPGADKSVKFKRHPLLERKKRRKHDFRGARSSSNDPLSMILTQHQEHKWRIAKITGLICVVVLVLIGVLLAFDRWRRESDRWRRLERVESRLEELDRRIAENAGHPKYLAALRAARWTDRGRKLDLENAKRWLARKSGYVETLAEGRPVAPSNYVNSRALFDMAYVPKGRFTIGKSMEERGDQDESPRHPVIISNELWISRTEISTAQYRMIYPNFRTELWGGYELDKPDQPAINVNWHEAMKFCEYLSEWDRELGALPEGYEYRLPTEAEWEYACRAGSSTLYYWGDDFKKNGSEFANSLDLRTAKRFDWRESRNMVPWDGHMIAAPVGSYKPNAFGLLDMSGNVWEWCLDWYNPEAYSQLPHVDPVQTTPVMAKIVKRKLFDAGRYTIESTSRVIRGGSWGNAPDDLRSANRDNMIPEEKNTGVGFRVVLARKLNDSDGQ